MEYTVDYTQPAGWTMKQKYESQRPPSGGWVSGGQSRISRWVPVQVSGRRIAVIDKAAQTIEALVVDHYASQDDYTYIADYDPNVAVAKRGSLLIRLAVGTNSVTIQQVNRYLPVVLERKTVVGLTRGEMSGLRSYA
ncbi:MAG TPA: hypothetical protein VI934_02070 [Candidatus Nanoarchaeia archaeon]|nr:hypothetical protein [Candidatus Nanoarchaeia archaeon]